LSVESLYFKILKKLRKDLKQETELRKKKKRSLSQIKKS